MACLSPSVLRVARVSLGSSVHRCVPPQVCACRCIFTGVHPQVGPHRRILTGVSLQVCPHRCVPEGVRQWQETGAFSGPSTGSRQHRWDLPRGQGHACSFGMCSSSCSLPNLCPVVGIWAISRLYWIPAKRNLLAGHLRQDLGPPPWVASGGGKVFLGSSVGMAAWPASQAEPSLICSRMPGASRRWPGSQAGSWVASHCGHLGKSRETASLPRPEPDSPPVEPVGRRKAHVVSL